METKIRKARLSDLDRIMEIFEGAKQIMRASGNHNQWNDGYPSTDIIKKDIAEENCYVLYDDIEILGTLTLLPGPDPTYSYIEGSWPDDEPYHVIHRIATAVPGRNVAKQMFDWAFEHISLMGCRIIRIDTHRDNCIMKHILNKYGFSMCGVIYLENGSPRDAYYYRSK